MRRVSILVGACVIASTLGIRPSVASAVPITRTFVGGVWSDPSAWTPAGVPVTGDSVRVGPIGSYFDLPGLRINNLEVTTPHAISSVPASTLRIDGNITVTAGSPPPGFSNEFEIRTSPVELTAGTHQLNVAAETRLLMPNVTGSGSIVKTGGGIASVGGATFTGAIDVQQGTFSGDFGTAAGGATLRAGVQAAIGGTSSEPFTIYAGTANLPTALGVRGEHTGPIALVGSGAVRLAGGSLAGPITGPSSVEFVPIGTESVQLSGANTYSGGTTIGDLSGVRVSGSSALGTGPVRITGSTPNHAQLELAPGAYVDNAITVDAGRFFLYDDGVATLPELAGPLILGRDTPVYVEALTEIGGFAAISGGVSGPGVLQIGGGSSQVVDVELGGAEPNTNGGVTMTTSNASTLLLSKPNGVRAVSRYLSTGATTDVVWSNHEQIADDATVSSSGTLSLGGATETLGPLDIRGGIVTLGVVDGADFTPGMLSVASLQANSDSGLVFGVGATSTDTLVVRGPVNLNGMALSVDTVLSPTNAPITLIHVHGTDPVNGTFFDLPEGAVTEVGSRQLQITYRGGDGNDVTLIEPGSGSSFMPVVPSRLLDTRAPGGKTVDARFQAGGSRPGGSVLEVDVSGRGGVPANASAVALNVTVTGAEAPGYVTVWPCGTPMPNASNLNFTTGQTIPNAVITKIGTGGKVCLYTEATTHLIADVTGYFPAGSSFISLIPGRLLDSRAPNGRTIDGQFQAGGTRPAASVLELQVTGRSGVPTTARSVVLNVTVTGAKNSGYVTVWPCGTERPNASNLNFTTGQTIPNAVVTAVGAGGKVCLFTESATDLIADVTGYFPAGSSFVSLVPGRLLDSRAGGRTIDGLFAPRRPLAGGSVLELQIAGRGGSSGNLSTVMLNVTAIDAVAAGYLTVWPCGAPIPNASNLNFAAAETIANAVITKVGVGGKVCIFAEATTHVIADVTGYFPVGG